MNDIMEKEQIENLIYEIRGKQVMLDSDLAKLFNYSTKDLNRNVKNNIKRFPLEYCFQLTNEEYNFLRCKNFTLKNGRGQHRKYLPYVFTEYGVTMLAGILKSEIAIKTSLRIVEAFVNLKKYVNNYEIRISNLETKYIEHDNKIDKLFEALDKKEKQSHIFFEGQIYDAYSLLVDILKEAEEAIIIIDNYIDKQILDIISFLDKEIILITNKYNNKDIEKYKEQYNNLNIKINNNFHDRFIIIDKKILYHSGASFKDLGKKCFSINKIEDKKLLENILEHLRQK